MNQISDFESDEITAFGIFNINLNLVISVSILIIIYINYFKPIKNIVCFENKKPIPIEV